MYLHSEFLRAARRGVVALSILLGLTTMAGSAQSTDAVFDTWRGFTVGSVEDAMYPSDGKAADFNGDGVPDIAVTHYWQIPQLTLLFGEGDGTFGFPTHYPAGVALFVESGDFDADGDEDIVVGNYGDIGQFSTVSIYFNHGDGTFGAAHPYFVGRRPREIAVSDVDLDGDLDLVVGVIGTTNTPIFDVAVLYNDGTGSFSEPSRFLAGDQDAFWFGLRPWSVRAGDVNGDGYPDLVVGHAYQFCSVLINDGAGGFGPPATQGVESGPWGIDNESGIALVDADHDGDLDLLFSCIYMRVYAEGDPGAIGLFRNQGDGTFGPAEVIPLISSSTGSSDLEVVDVTGDGWDDVVLGWEGGGELGWGVLVADGLGGFGETVRYAGGDSPTAVCPVDFDGDTDIDLLVPSRGSMMVSVHLNPGDGDFSSPPVFPIGGFKKGHFEAGDIDNDGDLDLVFTGGGLGYDGWLQIQRNHGNGTYGVPEWFDLPNVSRSIRIRDLNGDGWLDLVWADDPAGPPYDFKTMLNNGDGTFAPYRNWQVGTCGTRDLQTIDIDLDGDLDVLLGEYLTCFGGLYNYIYVRKNRGDGYFTPPYLIEGDRQGASSITHGDYNEDGKVDLAVTNPNGVVIYPGVGDGTYGPHTTIPFGFSKLEIMTARLNTDEHDDLVVQGSSMWVLIGRGDGTFEPVVEYEVDPFNTTAMDVGDADGDGDIDVVLANYFAHDVSVFLNAGDGSFTSQRYGAAGKIIDVLLDDFTGDGVQDVCVATTGDHLAFGSFGSQVLAGTGLETTDVGNTGPNVTLMTLANPSPFHTMTTLSYVLTEAGPVELSVFDTQGRLVRTLVEGEQSAGSQNAVWDATDVSGEIVPTGVYFVQLQTTAGERLSKIVKIR